MAFTEEDAVALVRKLAAMDLESGERAALDAVFAAASDGEVEGFAKPMPQSGYTEVEWTYFKTLGAVMGKPLGFKPGATVNR